jgi:hypothetical protein
LTAPCHRFAGKVAVEKFELGVHVERLYDRAIWELMYFGKARDLKTQRSKPPTNSSTACRARRILNIWPRIADEHASISAS